MPINRLINNADIEKVSEGLLSVKNNCFINKMLLSPTNPLLRKISGITSKNGRNDAKRLNIRVVTVSNDDKPKNRKTQRKADLRRRMVCKSLPVKE